MFTRLPPDADIADYNDIVDKMGGQLVDDIGICSILVSPSVVRTFKFLCAMAWGIPIVSLDWLMQIKANNYEILDTELYMLSDPMSEERFEFKLKESLAAARVAPLLKGFNVSKSK